MTHLAASARKLPIQLSRGDSFRRAIRKQRDAIEKTRESRLTVDAIGRFSLGSSWITFRICSRYALKIRLFFNGIWIYLTGDTEKGGGDSR